MGSEGRATIKTIAEEAGVTANTVSLALRDSPRVKKETKEMILDIAEKQGYVPNIMAESLRLGRSQMIALIFGDIGNPLYAIKTRKVEEILRKKGYQVMIMDTNEELEQEVQAVRSAIGRKVDGIVLCPCQKGRDALDMMKRYRIPCVLVGRSLQDGKEDTVVWDNYHGGKLATQYLISLGCRRILCLLGAKELTTSYERQSGYIDALKEAGLPVEEKLQIRVPQEEVDIAVKNLTEPFDGVFAFSDPYAWRVIPVLDKSVPIIGYDNVKSFFSLPLSIPSIAADLDLEAEYIVDLLLKRVRDYDRPVSLKHVPVKVVL